MRAWAAVVFVCVSGCPRPEPGPEAALRASLVGLRATGGGDGSESSVEVPAEAGAERRALADALEAARLERSAYATLEADGGDSRVVVLVEEEGAFHVESGVLGVAALDTPERAIAALHRALAREIVLGAGALLAEESRRAWLDEWVRYRDGTASPDALEVRVEGDRATTTTPLGDEIVLVREGAEWRVVSMRAAGLD